MQVRTSFLDSRVSRRDGPAISPSQAEPEAKSAARLAAEAAFSVSRLLSSAPAPAVTVRRGKGLGPRSATAPEGSLAAAPKSVDLPVALEATKGPRVFRLEQALLDIKSAGSGPQATEPAPSNASESPAKVRKKRRVAAEHRPGPVLQIFRAPDAVQATPGRGDAGADMAVSFRQLATLADLLASVQPILEDIQRAQALRF